MDCIQRGSNFFLSFFFWWHSCSGLVFLYWEEKEDSGTYLKDGSYLPVVSKETKVLDEIWKGSMLNSKLGSLDLFSKQENVEVGGSDGERMP